MSPVGIVVACEVTCLFGEGCLEGAGSTVRKVMFRQNVEKVDETEERTLELRGVGGVAVFPDFVRVVPVLKTSGVVMG